MPLNDLNDAEPIVDPATGRPTMYFMRMLMDRGTGQLTLEQQVALLNALEIIAGAGIDGGGILGDGANITLDANASAILDLITSTRGSVLYRGAAAWAGLGPGTSGHFLKTNGAGADPVWGTVSAGSAYLVSFFMTTAATSSEVLVIHSVTDAFDFPANFSTPSSKGAVGTNPTATFAINVQRQVNAAGAFASIGTVSISTGGVFTFSTTSGTAKSIAVNDVLKLIAPAVADATIANLAVTLRGSRT